MLYNIILSCFAFCCCHIVLRLVDVLEMCVGGGGHFGLFACQIPVVLVHWLRPSDRSDKGNREFSDGSTDHLHCLVHTSMIHRLKIGRTYIGRESTGIPNSEGQVLGRLISADNRPMSVRSLVNNRSIS